MSTTRSSVFAAVLALLALAPPLGAQDAAAGVGTRPCRLPGVDQEARCGTLQVWENRETRSGRRIPVNFAVIPARGPGRAAGAVAPLSGGPGSASVEGAGGYAWRLAGVRDTHDILLVDQRGTGGSRILPCALYGPPEDPQSWLGDFYPADRVAACAAALADSADVARYTTADFADDLDEVRAALGYERLDLLGVSYGTRAAQVYMRRHPERVRSAVLHGSVHTDARMPVYLARDAERAVDGVIAECEAEAACAAAFPNLKASLRAVVDRLSRAPAEVAIMHPLTGEPVTVRLSRELFGEAVRYLLYNGVGAGVVPAVVHQAARGDLAPVAEYALYARRNIVSGGGDGLYLSVTCAEDLPFIEPGEGARLAAGTFLGDYRVRHQQAACARWPHRPVDPSFRRPVRSDAPVLFLSGEWDPVTPPSQAEAVAAGLSRYRHVIVPSGAHGFDGLTDGWECTNRLIAAFIRDPDPARLDAGCVDAIRRLPFPTRTLDVTPERLSPAQMARFAGTYRTPQGLEIVLRMDGGRMRARVGGNDEALVVPVSATKLRVLLAPFFFLAATAEEGAPARLELEEWGRVTATLERVR